MENDRYLLVINDWPKEGCRRITPFDSYEAASNAGLSFLKNHADVENKLMIIRGEILALIGNNRDSE